MHCQAQWSAKFTVRQMGGIKLKALHILFSFCLVTMTWYFLASLFYTLKVLGHKAPNVTLSQLHCFLQLVAILVI